MQDGLMSGAVCAGSSHTKLRIVTLCYLDFLDVAVDSFVLHGPVTESPCKSNQKYLYSLYSDYTIVPAEVLAIGQIEFLVPFWGSRARDAAMSGLCIGTSN